MKKKKLCFVLVINFYISFPPWKKEKLLIETRESDC